jgi:pyridoxal phosphate-dependent aminotransferase EpsN
MEEQFVAEAFSSNWIAPLGPHVDAFEREFGAVVGQPYAAALSSGTAALHLALQLVGVGPGDDVLVSTLTFSATVNPICYLGARPVFVDCEPDSWNMDPALLANSMEMRARKGRLPKAVVVVHLYGQSANMDVIMEICNKFDVPVVEDAAEALGAVCGGKSPGTFGRVGIYSFNGNKIITTGGGGMLVSADGQLVTHARKLASQARETAPHYEHREIGYNYRLSNVLAAIGRGQLALLPDRVKARRRNFELYRELLVDIPGLTFQPEAPWGKHSRWLTCLIINPAEFGADREAVRLAMEAENIEARPVWKPMHCQPVFAKFETIGGDVADDLFARGLCLPSGSNLLEQDLNRVVEVIRRCHRSSSPRRAALG